MLIGLAFIRGQRRRPRRSRLHSQLVWHNTRSVLR
jgi:hypothetical protein